MKYPGGTLSEIKERDKEHDEREFDYKFLLIK